MFNFEGHDVRVVYRNDQPWFVTADVCLCLGLAPSISVKNGAGYAKYTPHIMKLDADEKKVLRGVGSSELPTHKWATAVSVISESGLYKLIMRSDKPAAKRFQNWVTREVLPALRKDGMYVMGEEKVKTGEMSEDEFVLKAMTMLQGKVSRLSTELDHAKAIIKDNLLFVTVQEWQANAGRSELPTQHPDSGMIFKNKDCMYITS